MIILFCLIIPLLFLTLKLLLLLFVKKFGKFSYDGFSVVGFTYDSKKDLFYSAKNAWQKNLGYTHLYDVGAPIFRMIIDTETIKFHYNNKNWLITFWKGQYGIVTGAEIGIYTTKQQKVNKKTLYIPADNNEMLNMSFILYKNGKKLMQVSDKHWWLTAFKLGMFSKPKELSMDINITFPNQQMLKAFLIGFKKLGYKNKDFKIVDNTFCFLYKNPKTRKVWTRTLITDSIRQCLNHKNVKLYNEYLSNIIESNGVDDSLNNHNDFIIVNNMIPKVLKNHPEEKDKANIASNSNGIYLNSNINTDFISKN